MKEKKMWNSLNTTNFEDFVNLLYKDINIEEDEAEDKFEKCHKCEEPIKEEEDCYFCKEITNA